jgi:outer membrane murein-binding lipoprotein Lpp
VVTDPWQVAIAVGAIATAVGTLVLAGATYWLGRKTREIAIETRNLAARTGEELDLLRQQTEALKAQAAAAQQDLEEVRRARVPLLRWQSPEAANGPIERRAGGGRGVIRTGILAIDIVLRNEGGAARIREFTIDATTGEQFAAVGLDVPSTLPAGEPITLKIRTERLQAVQTGERVVSIRLRYSDQFGLQMYETTPSLRVTFETRPTPSIATFIDSDERTPEQRRVTGGLATL